MTIQVWTDMSVLVGSGELRGDARDVTFATECVALPKTTFASDGWDEVRGGLKQSTLNIGAFQNMAAGGLDALAWADLGVADLPKAVTSASTDGAVAYFMRGVSLGYTPIDGAVGEMAITSLSAKSSALAVRGKLLHPTTAARTSSGTGTGRQLGAVPSTKSLYAALFVTAASGTTPSLTVKVQSDDLGGFTSATDRITFTAATGVTSEWKSAAGAITDDYWRITYTISGTDPSFSFAVVAGIA